MSQAATPLRFGLAGLGGYAGHVCDRILGNPQAADHAAELVAVSDPQFERFPRRVAQLRARGVEVTRDFSELLDRPIDAVWLPLPIDLHLPFTEVALSAGKAVICEKPAAGCVDDVDKMIAARDRSGLPVAIGFQDLYQPAVAQLKRRLVAGEFGRVRGARLIGCWPRSEHYFTRNDWAGRCRRDGRWVMDSPASNALAHFLHLTLFLLGENVNQSAQPTSVAAELYRANRIENYDTCSLRFTVTNDLPVLLAFTHACATPVEPIVTIEAESAQINYVSGRRIEIHRGDGKDELLPLCANPHRHMLSSFRDWVRNGPDEQQLNSSLEMARAHVVAVNAASEAAPVVDVPPQYIKCIPAPDGTKIHVIDDIVEAMRVCLSGECSLDQTGLAPWAHPPAHNTVNGYHHFAGPATAPHNGKVHAETFVAAAAKSASPAVSA
jgi:predicted dehydrogenase